MNRSPIASAGADQTIALPVDSVGLDGSASSDADGKIISYKWAKIAGPASSNIASASASKTTVNKLAAGVYRFELTVTDNGGLSAKDTVQVMVDAPGNQLPIACAGKDQTITLPTNTVLLDGSCSADPDNNITIYTWVKISGPISFTIANSSAVQTQVDNLVAGTYMFELKVTDAGGLSSKDTVQVLVTDNSISTINDSISTISGTATFIPFGSLSQPKYVMAATAADKVVFAGGVVSSSGYLRTETTTRSVDIYSLTTNTWSTATLGEPRNGLRLTTAGNKILFTSGEWNGNNYPKTIDIYDAAANTWSATPLPVSAPVLDYDATIVTANNKVFIAAPYRHGVSGFSSSIDVYDVSSNSWSSTALSEGRYGVTATAAGNKVLFAGGFRSYTRDDEPYDFLGIVDIYNLSTNTWSIAQLSEARAGMATAIVGNKVFFAGGYSTNYAGGFFNNASYATIYSNRVDIYDATNNTWSTANLSEGRYGIQAVTIGNKIMFAGGYSKNLYSDKVDIYDAATNTWTSASLSQPRVVSSTATVGNKVLFFTGYPPRANVIDIYDAATNTWSGAEIDKSLNSFAIAAGNQVFVGGGIIGDPGVYGTYHFTNKVWRLQF